MKFRAFAKIEKGEWILTLNDNTVLYKGDGIHSVTDLMERLKQEMSSRGWTEIQFDEEDEGLILMTIFKESLTLDE
jgi:hypothetical protein